MQNFGLLCKIYIEIWVCSVCVKERLINYAHHLDLWYKLIFIDFFIVSCFCSIVWWSISISGSFLSSLNFTKSKVRLGLLNCRALLNRIFRNNCIKIIKILKNICLYPELPKFHMWHIGIH